MNDRDFEPSVAELAARKELSDFLRSSPGILREDKVPAGVPVGKGSEFQRLVQNIKDVKSASAVV
jgi:hypothetical protein